MGEGIEHDIALRLLLQAVVADGRSGLQGLIDVAGSRGSCLILGTVRPHPRHSSPLAVATRTWSALASLWLEEVLLRLHGVQHAKFVLHVMADFVRDDVGFRKFAGVVVRAGVELVLHILEERRCWRIDVLIARTMRTAPWPIAPDRNRPGSRPRTAPAWAVVPSPLAAKISSRRPRYRQARRRRNPLSERPAGLETGPRSVCCEGTPPPARICAPLMSTLGSMPSAPPTDQAENDDGADAKAVRPPACRNRRPGELAPRSSSTLLLRRKSSQRIVVSVIDPALQPHQSVPQTPTARPELTRVLRHLLPSEDAARLVDFYFGAAVHPPCRL